MSVDLATFRRAMLAPDQPVPEGLTDGAGRPAGRRFAVYRNNVAVSLTEALETGFPAVRSLIGAENFKKVAGLYLRAHPPSSPLMMQYGADFPTFLSDFRPLAHIGYLADVARLELALRQSYHAADADPLDAARLDGLPPERLFAARVTLAPALRLIRSPWPLHAIWAYATQKDAPKPHPTPQDVLITRPGFDPVAQPLPKGGAAFIAALSRRQTLGQAHEAATHETPDFDLGPVFALLLTGAALTDLHHEEI